MAGSGGAPTPRAPTPSSRQWAESQVERGRVFLEDFRAAVQEEGQSAAPLRARNMQIVDVYSHSRSEVEVEMERIDMEERLAEERLAVMEASGTWRSWCGAQGLRFLASVADMPRPLIFLVVLGLVVALFNSMLDETITALQGAKARAAGDSSSGGTFVWWTLWTVGFALLAAGAGHLGTHKAEGSGIPQLKSIMAGTDLPGYLGWGVLLAKAAGVLLVSSSGLFVGREGPYVHVASILGSKLGEYVRYFRVFSENDSLRRQMLGAAVAAGAASVVGAPVGGVLFSIEVTTTFYMVSGLWRGIVAALVCVLTGAVLHTVDATELFRRTSFAYREIGAELVSFAVLAVLCGLLGALMVYLTGQSLAARRVLLRWGGPWARYGLTAAVALAVALGTFGAPFLRKSDRAAINDLFSAGGAPLRDWAVGGSVGLGVGLFLALRTLLTPLCITLPLPCGLFTPLFVLGAALGRLYGELALLAAPASAHVEPGMYAVVGAAALSAAGTHSVSVAVIVFELTGQIHYMIPVLVGVLVAVGVASMFQPSVYDVISSLQRLPQIGRAQSPQFYALRAHDVMRRRMRLLTLASSFVDAWAILQADADADNSRTGGGGGGYVGSGASSASTSSSSLDIPVVDNLDDLNLVGTVSRAQLEAVFQRRGTVRPGDVLAILRGTRADTASTGAAAGTGAGDSEGGDEEGGAGRGTVRARGASGEAATATEQSVSVRDLPLVVDVLLPACDPATPQEFIDSMRGQSQARHHSVLSVFPLWMRQRIRFNALDVLRASERLQMQQMQQRENSGSSSSGGSGSGSSSINNNNNTSYTGTTDSPPTHRSPLSASSSTLSTATSSPSPLSGGGRGGPWAGVPGVDADGVPLSRTDIEAPLPLDVSPFLLQDLTSMSKVHFFFATLLLAQVFVVRNGKLRGVILREDIATASEHLPRHARPSMPMPSLPNPLAPSSSHAFVPLRDSDPDNER